MNEAVRERDPEPPRIGLVVAVVLELAMLATFAFERSWPGLLLWVGYLYFSATWCVLMGHFEEADDD
jgi:hypothetical protein